ncbi:MAG: hypothetical protein AAF533_29165 [Acidobacteriota bacterium]
MTAKEMVSHLNQVRASIKDGLDDEGVRDALATLTGKLKACWSSEELKQALSDDSEVPTQLEEATTTLVMLWRQRRGSS